MCPIGISPRSHRLVCKLLHCSFSWTQYKWFCSTEPCRSRDVVDQSFIVHMSTTHSDGFLDAWTAERKLLFFVVHIVHTRRRGFLIDYMTNMTSSYLSLICLSMDLSTWHLFITYTEPNFMHTTLVLNTWHSNLYTQHSHIMLKHNVCPNYLKKYNLCSSSPERH